MILAAVTIFVVPVEPLYLLILILSHHSTTLFQRAVKVSQAFMVAYVHRFPLQHRLQISLFGPQTTQNWLEWKGLFSYYSFKKPLFFVCSLYQRWRQDCQPHTASTQVQFLQVQRYTKVPAPPLSDLLWAPCWDGVRPDGWSVLLGSFLGVH